MDLHWNRKDHPTSYRIALKLSNRPGGIEVAAEDIDLTGGSTRGMSSWILETSPLSGKVLSVLRHTIATKDMPVSRKMEAQWILWKRTGEESYLKDFFHETCEPHHGVSYARHRLALLAMDNGVVGELMVPDERRVELEYDEFRKAMVKASVNP